MWFDIIKVDEPTPEEVASIQAAADAAPKASDYTDENIERLKALRFPSEEDKKKIKEYEQSEGEKEEREKLIERLKVVTPNQSEGFANRMSLHDSYSNISDFKSFVEFSEKSFKRDAATEKSLTLLNSVIADNDKVTIVKEPELQYGTITGTVEIIGESGNTYNYDFQNDVEIKKDIYFDSDEVEEALGYTTWYYPSIEETRHIPMCLSAEGDLPVGDNIATMILGLLNDESSSYKISVIDKAIYGYDMIDWNSLNDHINGLMNEIDLTEFVIEKFEE